MHRTFLIAIAAATAVFASNAQASQVNVNAYNVSFGNLGTPVTLSLGAGLYNINYGYTGAAGQYQAWDLASANYGQSNQSPAVTGCDANGANCTQGWMDSYGYTINGAAGASGSFIDTSLTFSGSTPSGEAFATPAQALAAYSAALPSTSFSLASTSNVTFFIPDSSYNVDNYGGVTLNVNKVPEPASLVLLGAGLVGFAAARRRRRGASPAV